MFSGVQSANRSLNLCWSKINESPFTNSALNFLRDHPRSLQITQVVLNTLGAIACVHGILTQSISLGALGLATLGLTRHVSNKLSLFHSMSDHVFEAKECEGGRLYYEGDIPILFLESQDPYEAGRAHGYLLAPQLIQILDRLIKDFPHPEDEKEILTKARDAIPSCYLDEMNGIVEGVNQWIDIQEGETEISPISLENLLFANILPTLVYHFTREHNHEQIDPINELNIACTTVVAKDASKKIIFGRNLDWPSLDILGKHSLIIQRRTGKLQTAEVSMPGLVGTLTGMNEKGLSVAMNICNNADLPPNENGIPAMIYTRKILESFTQAPKLQQLNKTIPSMPYHLNVADPLDAISIHFHQKMTANREAAIRILLWKENPLITTNCMYSPEATGDFYDESSENRHRALEDFFNDNGNIDEDRITKSLSLFPVNNLNTIHTVQMIPQSLTMNVVFDNSYSASHPMLPIDLKKLFL